MNYLVGDKVIINSKNGWGGMFHKCKGEIESLEDSNQFTVKLNMGPGYGFSEVTHTLLCTSVNVLKVIK